MIGYLRCYSGPEFHLALEEFSAKYPDVSVKIEYAIGLNKAKALEIEIKSMYGDDIKVSGVDINSFSCANVLNNRIVIDCTASERTLNWSCMNNGIKNCFARCEIFMEGKDRNPDAYDMRVDLWYRAVDNEIIKNWLSHDTEENMEFHIGFGCSSETWKSEKEWTIHCPSKVIERLKQISYEKNENKGICGSDISMNG